MCLLRHFGRRRAAGADRPDRLVRDDEALMRRKRRDLPPEDTLHLARLALALGLAHTSDHGQPRLERGLGPQPDGLVRLAEVLPPLRVTDDRPLHTELEQHRRGHLAGESPLELPVDVLREHPHAAPSPRPLTVASSAVYAGHTTTSTPGSPFWEMLDGRRKPTGLVRALEHLPVPRDEHWRRS